MKFQIWKTVTLGVYGTVKAYHEALTKAGFRIGDWASDILNKIQVSRGQVELDLVVRSVAELGFKEDVRLDQVYARAKKLGLKLCPPEVGPALRLAYPDQSYGEWFRIAMRPISDSVGDLRVFGVELDGDDQWLYSYYSYPVYLGFPDYRFVFVLPRK